MLCTTVSQGAAVTAVCCDDEGSVASFTRSEVALLNTEYVEKWVAGTTQKPGLIIPPFKKSYCCDFHLGYMIFCV